ncbi:MAG TPA: hypothetical protein PLW65_04020 [Pseudomonadota bacterium]|nr:hypothetical protein [Pseudomonadota bacterium]
MSNHSVREQVRAAIRRGRPDVAFDRVAEILLSGRHGLAAQYEALSLLDYVAQRVPATAATADRRAAAAQLQVALAQPRRRVGSAEFPAVAGSYGRFVAVSVSASHGADEIHPADLAVETQEATHAALVAARSLAGDTRPLRIDFECGEEEVIRGRSCGLAVGMAVVSFLHRLELPETYLFSGELAPHGRLLGVAGVAEKLALRRECRPQAVLVLPAEHHTDEPCVEHAGTLTEVLDRLGIHPEMDLTSVLAAVRNDYHCGRWPAAAQRAQALLLQPSLRIEERLELHTILLAAANHRGDQAQAREQAAAMQRLLTDHSIPSQLAAIALANAAVQAVDFLRPAEAEALLAQAAELSIKPTDPAWIHVSGTRARVRILQGDLAAALTIRKQNAQLCRDDERARCLGDLADGYLRSGELELAGEALSAARRALAELRSQRRRREYLRQTESYLTLYAVRLSVARADVEQARALLAPVARLPAEQLIELRIESALLATSVEERLDAIDCLFSSLPHQDQPIFRVLYLRARLLAGDGSAQSGLQTMLGLSGVAGSALCSRIPY